MIVFQAHVPRTGGTAAGYSLSIGFSVSASSIDRSREQVRQDPKMAQETVAVSGHFGWGLHEEFARDHLYFIVLRDPVERVGSLYDYVLARKAHRYNELWTATPLHRVLAEKLSPIPLSNAVVRQLGGGFGHPKSPVTEAMMERAWKNISQDNVIVTFTDMLNDGLLQLAGQTGVRLRRVTKIHNAAKKRMSNSDIPRPDPMFQIPLPSFSEFGDCQKGLGEIVSVEKVADGRTVAVYCHWLTGNRPADGQLDQPLSPASVPAPHGIGDPQDDVVDIASSRYVSECLLRHHLRDAID